MSRFLLFSILFVALACRQYPTTDSLLLDALLSRAAADQQQMQAVAAHFQDSTYHRRLRQTLINNALWLDSVVEKRGWPGYALVDTLAAGSAFLIAQHADSVLDVQQRLLAALRIAVAQHQARPGSLAFLEDRVRKATDRPQLYGTQPAYDSSGNAVQPVVEAPDSLDARRAAVGLPPMADYLDTMRAVNARLRSLQKPN